MDVSQLDSFTFTIAKGAPTSATNVTLQAKANTAVADLPGLYASLKAQIMGSPEVKGLALLPKGEDCNLSQSSGTLQATLRFGAPAAPKA